MTSRRVSTLAITTILLAAAFASALPPAAANHGVTITSPAANAAVTRGTPVNYTAVASLGTSPATCTLSGYSWNIAGTVLSGANVAYAFPASAAVGTKTATVTVSYTGASHCNSRSASVTVNLTNVGPIAALSAPSAVAGEPFTLDASASRDADTANALSFAFSVDGAPSPASAQPTFTSTILSAGSHIASVTVTDSDGATATVAQAFTVAPGPVASILVDGPGVVSAGSTQAFSLVGYDAYGNVAPLAQATLSWDAPTTVGFVDVSYAEAGVTGTKSVQVVASDLATILIGGPDSVVVGTTTYFPLSGQDAYGNPVGLSQPHLVYEAPTTVGTDLLAYVESGVSATKPIDIVAGALATIELSGPTVLSAGATGVFNATGFDSYGNPVALETPVIEHVASTTIGFDYVCANEQLVSGCVSVQIVPGAVATILVRGASSLVAATTDAFVAEEYDAYGNYIQFTSFDFTAPKLAGTADVSFEAGGVVGTKTIQVLPDAIASVQVVGPTTVVAGVETTWNVLAWDQHGNAVTPSRPALTYTLERAGDQVVATSENGIWAELQVTVLSAALYDIGMYGPSVLAAGDEGVYSLWGTDAYGNSVKLEQSTLAYTAPTIPGDYQACYSESGASECFLVQVTPAELASILITGPDTLTVDTVGHYVVTHYDQYLNVRDTSAMEVHAPIYLGSWTLMVTQGDVVGEKVVTFLPDVLARIAIHGPTFVVAGTTATYHVYGMDRFDNRVFEDDVLFDAPTVAGQQTVSYESDGVLGALDVTVTPDVLDHKVLDAPATAVAKTVYHVVVTDLDRHENVIDRTAFDVQAFIHTGPQTFCSTTYLSGGEIVEGCATTLIVPDALASIHIFGPDEVIAGSATEYQLTGTDQYWNDVPLAQATLVFEAPATVGPAAVTYEEAGIVGKKDVFVTHGPVDRVLVAAVRDTTNVNRPVAVSATALDAYGNVVPGVSFTFSTTLGDISAGSFVSSSAGIATLTATVDGEEISGSMDVTVVDTLKATLALGQASYKASETLLGGVAGTGTVAFEDEVGVEGALVRVTVVRLVAGMEVPVTTVSTRTDAAGGYSFSMPVQARLPGEHIVRAAATWPGNAGSAEASYDVTLG